jgi:hypothetical protein
MVFITFLGLLNKLPETGWLITTRIHSLIALQVKNLTKVSAGPCFNFPGPYVVQNHLKKLGGSRAIMRISKEHSTKCSVAKL